MADFVAHRARRERSASSSPSSVPVRSVNAIPPSGFPGASTPGEPSKMAIHKLSRVTAVIRRANPLVNLTTTVLNNSLSSGSQLGAFSTADRVPLRPVNNCPAGTAQRVIRTIQSPASRKKARTGVDTIRIMRKVSNAR